MRLTAKKAGFPHCCGLNVVGGFYQASDSERLYDDRQTIEKMTTSGTGLMVATFTNTETQRLAYEELRKKWDILFQSTPRRNRNSSNKVILVVYGPKRKDKRKPPPDVEKEGSSASWPAPVERRGEKLPAF